MACLWDLNQIEFLRRQRVWGYFGKFRNESNLPLILSRNELAFLQEKGWTSGLQHLNPTDCFESNPLHAALYSFLWNQGFWITEDAYYGGDLLVYLDLPSKEHAIAIVKTASIHWDALPDRGTFKGKKLCNFAKRIKHNSTTFAMMGILCYDSNERFHF